MSYVVRILNAEGEAAGYLTADAQMTGSAFRAYHFASQPTAEALARRFCEEHRSVEFVGGCEREYTFGYEVEAVPAPQLV